MPRIPPAVLVTWKSLFTIYRSCKIMLYLLISTNKSIMEKSNCFFKIRYFYVNDTPRCEHPVNFLYYLLPEIAINVLQTVDHVDLFVAIGPIRRHFQHRHNHKLVSMAISTSWGYINC